MKLKDKINIVGFFIVCLFFIGFFVALIITKEALHGAFALCMWLQLQITGKEIAEIEIDIPEKTTKQN